MTPFTRPKAALTKSGDRHLSLWRSCPTTSETEGLRLEPSLCDLLRFGPLDLLKEGLTFLSRAHRARPLRCVHIAETIRLDPLVHTRHWA